MSLNKYDSEQFKEDVEWLRAEMYSDEVSDFLFNVVKKSFAMTKEEFIKFLNEVKR
jgi:hypothetical protein